MSFYKQLSYVISLALITTTLVGMHSPDCRESFINSTEAVQKFDTLCKCQEKVDSMFQEFKLVVRTKNMHLPFMPEINGTEIKKTASDFIEYLRHIETFGLTLIYRYREIPSDVQWSIQTMLSEYEKTRKKLESIAQSDESDSILLS